MEPNHNGTIVGSALQEFPDFPEISLNGNYSNEWIKLDTSGGTQDSPQFHSSYGQPSFPSYSHNHGYNDGVHFGQSHYQPPYQHPLSYYQSNPSQAPYQNQHQSLPTNPVYARPVPPPRASFDIDNGRDYHTPCSPWRDVSSVQRQEESPMQRMQQLTQQEYGGPLAAAAAQSAAAEAADATRTARRISPPSRGKREPGEETVKEVLYRQYAEQRRQEEQKQQAQQQQLLHNCPSFPSTPQSVHLYPSMDSPTSSVTPYDAPNTPATPIFTFPVVTRKSPPPTNVSAVSPPTSSCPSSLVETTEGKKTNDPLKRSDADVEWRKISRLKTRSLMMSLHRANTVAAQANGSVELLGVAALHQAATVVQSLEAKEKAAAASASSRKRPFEEPSPEGSSDAPLKPGMRTETNEKGECVERLYVLVHHCNHNDPDYDPNGVLMPYDKYKEEQKREDLVTISSYSSIVNPYEYVDFRVKKAAAMSEKETQATKAAA